VQKFIEVTGKTDDEALSKGLQQLGLDRDDVSVEILERGKTGFLGIGSVPAKVRLTYEAPDEPETQPAPQSAPVEQAKPAPKAEKKAEREKPAQKSATVKAEKKPEAPQP
jgi:spoIIIJ-associated protein